MLHQPFGFSKLFQLYIQLRRLLVIQSFLIQSRRLVILFHLLTGLSNLVNQFLILDLSRYSIPSADITSFNASSCYTGQTLHIMLCVFSLLSCRSYTVIHLRLFEQFKRLLVTTLTLLGIG